MAAEVERIRLDRERRAVVDAPRRRPPRQTAAVRALLQRVQPRRGPRGGPASWDRSGPASSSCSGVGHDDDEATADALARRIGELRILEDGDGRTNRSLLDVGGEALVVSQFTLYADTSQRPPARVHGRGRTRRRDAPGSVSRAPIEALGVRTALGEFGAEMEVELVNDGPFTIWLDTADRAPGETIRPLPTP